MTYSNIPSCENQLTILASMLLELLGYIMSVFCNSFDSTYIMLYIKYQHCVIILLPVYLNTRFRAVAYAKNENHSASGPRHRRDGLPPLPLVVRPHIQKIGFVLSHKDHTRSHPARTTQKCRKASQTTKKTGGEGEVGTIRPSKSTSFKRRALKVWSYNRFRRFIIALDFWLQG